MTQPSDADVTTVSPEERRALLRRLLAERASTDEAVHPLSHNQRSMWFLQQLAPDSTAYNLAVTLRITTPLDLGSFQRALDAVVARHASLRTTFLSRSGEPFQVVHATSPMELEIVDAVGWSEDEVAIELERALRTPFDLAAGPPRRVGLLRRGDQDHVLQLVIHHIITDGWSLWIMLDEIRRLYAAEVNGTDADLAPLEHQHTDFVTWQADLLESAAGERMWEHWERTLAAPPPLDLPTDHTRPPVNSFQGRTVEFSLDRRLVDALADLGAANGATLFGVLTSAYLTLLHRYTGDDDILVGTPVLGRRRAEFVPVLGDFVNTVVVRGDLAGDPGFADLVARTQPVLNQALNNQDFPFSTIVERLAPDRDLSRNPIVQTSINLMQPPASLDTAARDTDGVSLPDFGGLEVEGMGLQAAQQEGQFDLSLEMVESASGIAGNLKYRTDLFTDETAERLVHHFESLLRAAVENPDETLSRLSLTDTLPTALEPGREIAPSSDTVLGLIDASTAVHGDRPAIIDAAGTWTHDGLRRRSNQLARALQQRGVGSGDLVAVRLGRSAETVSVLLAVWKAGAAYVPLDPGFPEERLAFIVDDAGAQLVVDDAAFRELSLVADAMADDDLGRDIDASALAYVIYTSGSTGRPKGVEIEHRSVVNLLRSMANEPGFAASDVILAITTFSFDISVLELFLPLVQGGALVLADEDDANDPARLAGLIEEHGVTILQATPSSWSMLLAADWVPAPTLRTGLCGGEALSRTLADRVLALDLELWNLYGPTETTVWSSAARVEPGDGPVSIGSPIDNTRLHVLDRNGVPTPLGVPGELYIGGSGLARGYRGRPDETAARFVDLSVDGRRERWYRTGDVVRRRSDDRLDFVGRVDHQVKVRGHRIELGEVEQAVLDATGVSEAIVVIQGVGDDARLVTFVQSDTPIDGVALRAELAERLPAYMLPAACVTLAELPRTPNHKVDRRALADHDVVIEGSAPSARRSDLERLVGQTWVEVLDIGEPAPGDDFFDLGGHSLLATQVISRLAAVTGISIPLADFFDAPTVAGLARRVAQGRGGEERAPSLIRHETPASGPLSAAQARMWFMHQLAGNSAAYHVMAAFEIAGPLDYEFLGQAVETMIERHELLRTRIRVTDDGPIQEIHDPFPVPRDVLDYTHVGPDDFDAAVEELFARIGATSFDFEAHPAWRMLVARFAHDRHVLIGNMHHVIFDQWSSGLFYTQLIDVYESLVAGTEPAYQPAPRYLDFANWQNDWFRDGVLERQLAYWREQLAGLPTLELPTDRVRPPLQSYDGDSVRRVLSPDLVAAIRAASDRARVTPFMFVLATFALVLEKYSSETDIPIGIPVANRHRLEVERIIGTFVNSLVVRCDLSDDPTFEQLLERVRTTALDAYARQDLPFEQLVQHLEIERDLSRQPLFQVMANMINAPFDADPRSDLDIEGLRIDRAASQFDLSLNVVLDDYDVLEPALELEYSTALFDRSSIERMIEHQLVLLDRVAGAPDQPISVYELITQTEADELESIHSATSVEFATEQTLWGLVSDQIARTPDRVAVSDDQGALTYAELDARVRAVAAHLTALGAAPGEIVGIHLDRDIDMVVALLGVLRSGAAYLPLDPSFPTDRLEYMLEDSAARILVVDRAHGASAPAHAGPVVVIEDVTEVRETIEPAPAAADARDLAYVIYTSGSTGKPKGVELQHRSVVNFLASMAREPGLRTEDRLLAVTTLSFDISVLEIFLPLTVGAEVIIAPASVTGDGVALDGLLARSGATVMQATPATWSMLTDAGWQGTPSLRQVLCGGEALSRDLADRVLERAPELWNMYGPTETTIWSAVEKIEAGDGPITIGNPIDNTTFHVVDTRLRELPIGVPGELLIGGDGLARGYLGKPELTADRFIPDSLGADPNGRLYRTGDRVRRRADGRLEFLGRLDSQVKVRGYRIELGEIEHRMAAHPDVRDVVVIVRPGRTGDAELVGYVIHAGDDEIAPGEWRTFLRSDLPDYMVPTSFVSMEEFPLTPNRKVDRRALPAPAAPVRSAETRRDPQTPTEHVITGIWKDVLVLDELGVDDDFFDVGGHSLLAVRIFSRIATECGVTLELGELFQHPTIALLAATVDARRSGDAPSEGLAHLVQLHQGEPGATPFFCVHGAGGQVLFMQGWGPHLGSIPLVGVQAKGFDGVNSLHESVEAMATDYVAEIIAHQPTGPLYVGGYSGGGTVALEMARQLTELGREVAVLVLIDTYHPGVNPRKPTLRERIGTVMSDPADLLRKLVRKHIVWRIIEFRNRNRAPDDAISPDVREFYMFDHLDAIRTRYQPRRYQGQVLLLRSVEAWPIFDHVGPLRGWEGTLDDVEVRKIPGDHDTAVRPPNLEVTLEQLRAGLLDAGIGDATSS